eukprot:TRINITY_DN17431_c0_g1_i2.p1 TRINITY_DN17431_c0_g1~~TRINITY_DN17431_c0_g1_i2.p1  ORF type:complete len:381 (-),score=51.51 TRINITY_DN17431_c0_g1_i2:139-1281(-)
MSMNANLLAKNFRSLSNKHSDSEVLSGRANLISPRYTMTTIYGHAGNKVKFPLTTKNIVAGKGNTLNSVEASARAAPNVFNHFFNTNTGNKPYQPQPRELSQTKAEKGWQSPSKLGSGEEEARGEDQNGILVKEAYQISEVETMDKFRHGSTEAPNLRSKRVPNVLLNTDFSTEENSNNLIVFQAQTTKSRKVPELITTDLRFAKKSSLSPRSAKALYTQSKMSHSNQSGSLVTRHKQTTSQTHIAFKTGKKSIGEKKLESNPATEKTTKSSSEPQLDMVKRVISTPGTYNRRNHPSRANIINSPTKEEQFTKLLDQLESPKNANVSMKKILERMKNTLEGYKARDAQWKSEKKTLTEQITNLEAEITYLKDELRKYSES